jgi:predicted acyltransferase
MTAEVLQLSRVADQLPGQAFWSWLAFHQSHVEWVGCSLHDLIQPSFSFLVGVVLPYSQASRLAKGGRFADLFAHAVWRSLVLVGLGIFLRSQYSDQTNFTFEDTLTQIGLGYPVLFWLGFKPPSWQLAALAVILVGYWLAFALYPLPPSGFDFARVGVPADWGHLLTGFAAHWNKNANLAWTFDTWFLNLFPRAEPFRFNGGGYATLSFVPTLGTMLLGLWAGNLLRQTSAPAAKLRRFVLLGVAGLGLGLLLDAAGICPNVKRIWTPTWVLFSGGWCFLLLAGFYWLTEVRGWSGWALPLLVIGTNSIAAYMVADTMVGYFKKNLLTHLGQGFPELFGPAYSSLVLGGCVLALEWLISYWLYRRKIFIKI